jgi:carbon-monoxide dehydrogenase large subunit
VKAVGVHTNLTPIGAYRGAGRPEATYAVERIVDAMAAELRIDPAELRRRNLLPPEAFPYDNGCGVTYDSGRYQATLDRALELADYHQVRAEQRARLSAGDPVLVGIGLSTYVEVCGSGAQLDEDGETMTVRLRPDGDVDVVVGSAAYGQGHVTTWTGLVADRVHLPPERVHVVQGDTDLAPDGFDSYGSRTVPVLGPALVSSCDSFVADLLRLASAALETDVDDLEIVDGRVGVRGDREASVSFQQLAALAASPAARALGVPEDLAHPCSTDLEILTFPNGTHVTVVEVDTETGRVRLREHIAVDDVGTVLNPVLVDGQVHGGIAQGIGQALYEEMTYDAGLPTAPSFADYGVPAAGDLLAYRTDRLETPTPNTPLGAKGAGEAGATGSTPAVVNAVLDALAPLGVTGIDMPVTPQRVWTALRAAQNGRSIQRDRLPAWSAQIEELAAAAGEGSTPMV